MGLAKAIVLAIFNTSALVLFMAACGTAWLENTSGSTKNEYSYYRICTQVNGGDATCKDLNADAVKCDKRMEMINAGRAFTLITTILVGLLTLLSLYRIFNNLILVKAFIVGKIYVVVGLIALVFAVLQWIVGFALYSEEYCGVKLADNTTANKIGPSAPAGFVASCIWLVSLLLECILSDVSVDLPEAGEENKPSAEPAAEEPKKESPKAVEEAKKESPKAEEAKKETPKADE